MTSDTPARKPEKNLATEDPQPASMHTRACQAAQRLHLPLHDDRAFDDARRGLVAPLPPEGVLRPNGRPVWNLQAYGFLAHEQAPDSVHPGLWRHARLNMVTGLFKVCDRVYQVRGMDLANMTILEGDTGLIIIDPLTSTQVAAAALALYHQHRPQRPVVAVVYTHSHVDHFGGVRGVIDEADVLAGRVQVIAPVGFMDDAISETVMAGNAMTRRALFQYGALLPRGERGQVDAGLGKAVSAGTVTLIAPNRLITQPVESLQVDGIECVFELTPGAEAPAEMIIHHPGLRVLNMAEITSHNFHNLLPLRGAQVRDARAWASYLVGARQRYAAHSDVLIAQHHWPVWGSQSMGEYLLRQHDLYKFVHDQTLRLMNHGHTGGDIAEAIRLPEELQKDWSTHSFYGHLKHNVKAVYQRYLGAYEGHPAFLDPLPREAQARKTIDYMGGVDVVLSKARADLAAGEYRWVADVCARIVWVDPSCAEARRLCAQAMEQLGYQTESSTWRNAYLQGARELRQGSPRLASGMAASRDMIRALPLAHYFDYLAMRLNGPRAARHRLVMHWLFSEPDASHVLTLSNGVLRHACEEPVDKVDVQLRLSRATLDDISLEQLSFADALDSGRIQLQGPREIFEEFLMLLDTFDRGFAVLEPLPPISSFQLPE
jgi:alkyl sulfatase BDS1-like metallo-beta-lactamase superfamily hydrolase